MTERLFDLNLLKTFDALWRERNVTRAAERLGLTQPAVSNGLARLREVFSDELFIRTPHGVAPTDRCVSIAKDVQEALRHAERAVQSASVFTAETSARAFRVASVDVFDVVFLPQMMERLAALAPSIDLRTRDMERREALDLIDAGEIDVGFYKVGDAPKRIAMERIGVERLVLIARDGHPTINGPIDVETYAGAAHALFSLVGDAHGPIDDKLAALGLKRRIAVTSAHVLTIGEIVRRSDIIASIPSRIARRLVEMGGVKAYPTPIESGEMEIAMYWNRSADADPGLAWFRDVIKTVCRETPTYAP
ncbi:MAG: LysR family transcriptional regulator [Pseudomonadota bacterium]